jgi:hypothetical protein
MCALWFRWLKSWQNRLAGWGIIAFALIGSIGTLLDKIW